MGNGNMICPRCKTFQPAADTCRECGVVVAKLWARQAADRAPAPARRPAWRRSVADVLAVGIAAVAALGVGAWTLFGGGSETATARLDAVPENPYLQAARQAQRAAERAAERIAAANAAVEMGTEYYAPSAQGRATELDLDLESLVIQLNAVADTRVVALRSADLERAVRACARIPDRYFPPLRYEQRDDYPLPAPPTRPYEATGLYTRVMCEGDDGRILRSTAPNRQGDHSACWSRQRGFGDRSAGPPSSQGDWIWVRMQWDEEAGRWSIYTRADQRAVDRSRLSAARLNLDDDVTRRHRGREEAARQRIPGLTGEVEQTREALRVAAAERTRRDLTRTLGEQERRLRDALVEARYTQICRAAAGASLSALEAML
jgi:hypothetical protein